MLGIIPCLMNDLAQLLMEMILVKLVLLELIPVLALGLACLFALSPFISVLASPSFLIVFLFLYGRRSWRCVILVSLRLVIGID